MRQRFSSVKGEGEVHRGQRLLLRQAGRLVVRGRILELEPKDALLLAYLAVEGPTPRARLAALLWPDADEERARGNLRQRLLRLKRTAGVTLVAGNPLVQLAEGIAHDLDDASEVLADLDPSGAGGMADWLQALRERRRRTRCEGLAAASAQAQAEGDLDTALAHARALVELDPLSEHAHRRVMTLHYLRGDTAAALEAYAQCRQLLKRELKTEPSPETEAVRARLERAAAPAAPAALGAMPISVLRPPRLVGRDEDWAVLQAAWDAGEAALILGEAGMGKTRLASDFARAQGRLLFVAARSGDERVVYALVARLLRQLPRESLAALDASVRAELARLLPEFGQAQPIRSEADRARFYNAVAAALAAQAGALAGIVLDDLHFADEASVELVQYLYPDSGLRWLFAARPAEIGAAARALIEAVRGKGRSIELAPLTVRQIQELVESLELPEADACAWAPRLLRHTGGNPLFVLETVKAWLSQAGAAPGAGATANLPAVSHIGGLIERRIGRLSAQAIRLARCAAVAGQDFSADLAVQVLGVRTLDLADAWAELERAQVFRDGAFAHDLIHEAALASVPAALARELHAQIARSLAARDAPPARLADHWLAAGRQREALAALLRAAATARQETLRLVEAAQLYERAAAVAEQIGDDEAAFEALHALADTWIGCDRGRLDTSLADRLDAHAKTPRQRARALALRAQMLMHRGRHAEAIAHAQRAAELARAAGDEELAVAAQSDAAAAASQSGDSERAVRILRPLVPWVLEHGGDETRLNVLGHLALCLDNIDLQPEAQAMHQRVIEAALRARRFDEAVIANGNLAISLLDVGRPLAALRAIGEARKIGAVYDALPGPAETLSLFEGAAAAALRQYRAALAAFEAALADLANHALGRASLRVHRACLWIQLGQTARAQRELAALASLPELPAWLEARRLQMLGRCAWSSGLRAEAARHWQRAAELAPTGERAVLAAMIALDHALVQPADDALTNVRKVLARAETLGHAGSVLAAQTRLAQLSLAHGDAATAFEALTAARRSSEDVEPNDLYRGELWLAAVGVARATGRADEAAAQARAAAAEIRRIAASELPAELRDGFLHRNPVNRELLTLATRG